MKLIHFSSESLLSQFDELAEFRTSIEISKNEKHLSPEQILKEGFDVIELGPGDFQKFLPFFQALDIRMSRLGVADAIVKMNGIYHPVNLLADAVYSTISSRVPKLKISEPAVVIGEYDFILAMSYKLAQSGFLKVIIALDDKKSGEKIKSIITRFVFGMEITTISLEELTQLESSNGLLIINIEKEKYPDAHESITYFNFLSSNAVFADLQSKKENSLVEEARRAELVVVGEVEILKTKYSSLLELF
jgi:shikimate 5-dehydrogenase